MTATKNQTMIIVNKTTRDKLAEIKAYKLQTFNEVLIGLIKNNDGKVVVPHE